MTLGCSIIITLDEDTSVAKQEVLLLVAGIGFESLFQPPLIGLQAAMPLTDMGTSASKLDLPRTLSGTIFQSELTNRLGIRSIPGSGYPDCTTIARIEPAPSNAEDRSKGRKLRVTLPSDRPSINNDKSTVASIFPSEILHS